MPPDLLDTGAATRPSRIRHAALAMVLTLSASGAFGDDFNTHIDKAKSLMQSGQYAQALAAALEARGLKSDDFRSHYYEAMAQLGLGKHAEAQAAVRAAEALAPNSAKASIRKLAQLAAAGEPASAPAAPQRAAASPSALIVRCDWVDTDLKKPDTKENRYGIFKIQPRQVHYWRNARSAWTTNMCVLENAVVDTSSIFNVVHKCELSDERIDFTLSYSDDTWHSREQWTINRLTGGYQQTSTRRYLADGDLLGSTGEGSCKPVPDPTAGMAPKF
jgi:tetratricopeptide (TPR) repeat protein